MSSPAAVVAAAAAAAGTDLKRYVSAINLTALQTLHDNLRHGNNDTSTPDGFPENNAIASIGEAWWEAAPVVLLILLYAFVIGSGVFGNASLLLTVCTQTSARFRNPLLVALCVADLLVAGAAAPMTMLAMVAMQQRWSLSMLECKGVYFMQSFPVAASTISLLMLSLDRYATVKHPRLAQLRERRFLPMVLAFSAWLGAFLLCAPLLLVYRLSDGVIMSSTASGTVAAAAFHHPTSTTPTATSSFNMSAAHDNSHHHHHYHPKRQRNATMMTSALLTTSLAHLTHADHQPDHNTPHRHLIDRYYYAPEAATSATSAAICYADFGSGEMRTLYVGLHACLVFVLPALGVLLNHLGVRKKLCALSLTARAAHGELPLPMPILRRPTHMIIVTGMANAGRAVVDAESSADDELPEKEDAEEEEVEDEVEVLEVVATTTPATQTSAAQMVPSAVTGLAAVEKAPVCVGDISAPSTSTPAAVIEVRHELMAGQVHKTTGPNRTTAMTATGTNAREFAAAEAAAALAARTKPYDNGAADERRCMMAETRMRCNPRTPRSIRRGQMAQSVRRGGGGCGSGRGGGRGGNSTRRNGSGAGTGTGTGKIPSSELPLPQTSTLRSRRRLANLLVFSAGIFICCWTPHVLCILGAVLSGGGNNNGAGGSSNSSKRQCTAIVSEYTLLLGYAHSAISPLLYWLLNHNSLRQSSCGTILRLTAIQKFMRVHLRAPAPPPPPSSTNEAALGPFNPRYIKARPQPHHYRPPASSYNLC